VVLVVEVVVIVVQVREDLELRVKEMMAVLVTLCQLVVEVVKMLLDLRLQELLAVLQETQEQVEQDFRLQ
tara:strand:+ start:128 stop:337 length:210 start_codon:yes stop_codon:yes gene_type:complete